MTWRDKLELGLKEDAAFRKDNLPPSQIRGPEIAAGPGRSPEIPMARGDIPSSPELNPAERAATTAVVALFNASDDTVEMVGRMLESGGNYRLVSCRFADLRKGVVDFGAYLREHRPQVVIVDISPPYEQNWEFFRTLKDDVEMRGRGLVVTTTNKDRLDELVGHDSLALEVVGKPYDLHAIMSAIRTALPNARS